MIIIMFVEFYVHVHFHVVINVCQKIKKLSLESGLSLRIWGKDIIVSNPAKITTLNDRDAKTFAILNSNSISKRRS